MNVAEIVTNRIIEKLESGSIPWIKPWDGGEAINYISRKPYRGINRMLLDGGEYLTFKQIQAVKGKIKKGAKSHLVVFYKQLVYDNEDSEEEAKVVRLLRYYKVFKLEDTEGIETKIGLNSNNAEIGDCESILTDYVNRERIDFNCAGVSDRAYYRPSEDKIVVPRIEQFSSSEHYYATAFHEAAHSTGHHSRLDRFKADAPVAAFGSESYSREELIAEITSAMLCSKCGIDKGSILDNAAGYVQSWLKALKNDKNMIVAAAAKAEKAYSYILNEEVA